MICWSLRLLALTVTWEGAIHVQSLPCALRPTLDWQVFAEDVRAQLAPGDRAARGDFDFQCPPGADRCGAVAPLGDGL